MAIKSYFLDSNITHSTCLEDTISMPPEAEGPLVAGCISPSYRFINFQPPVYPNIYLQRKSSVGAF